MTWFYKGEPVNEVPEGYVGFIYRITNLVDGRIYVGKKKFLNKKTSVKTVTLKNGTKKKKKVRSMVESDWREYWSSSEEVQEDVKKLGPDSFRRDIIQLCQSEGLMTYLETKEILVSGALESNKYYNKWIMARVRKDHILKYFT